MQEDEENLIIAFLEGAKWWEFILTGESMSKENQNTALKEAKRKIRDGKLIVPTKDSTKENETE